MTFTHEEITAMAKEAGLMYIPQPNSPLVRIVKKAVQVERERFALECIDLVAFHGGSVELEAAIRAIGQKEELA